MVAVMLKEREKYYLKADLIFSVDNSPIGITVDKLAKIPWIVSVFEILAKKGETYMLRATYNLKDGPWRENIVFIDIYLVTSLL